MSKDLVERMCEEAFGSHTDFNKDVMKKTLSVVLSHLEEVALSDVFTKVTLKPEYRSWMEKGGAE